MNLRVRIGFVRLSWFRPGEPLVARGALVDISLLCPEEHQDASITRLDDRIFDQPRVRGSEASPLLPGHPRVRAHEDAGRALLPQFLARTVLFAPHGQHELIAPQNDQLVRQNLWEGVSSGLIVHRLGLRPYKVPSRVGVVPLDRFYRAPRAEPLHTSLVNDTIAALSEQQQQFAVL